MKSLVASTLLVLGLMTFATPSAFADSVSLTLNQSAAFGAGSYGTVDLNLVGSTIEVKVTVNNGWVIDTGAHSAVAWNEAGANTALSVSGLPTGYSFENANNVPAGAAGSYAQAGIGTFEFALNGPGPSDSNRVNVLTFTVSRSGGFSTVGTLIDEAPGNTGTAVFAVDILKAAPCTDACTGLVFATRAPVTTPEPTSFLLLGTGLVGLVTGRRILRK